MSGICGLVHLGGGPIDPADYRAMQAAMRHWGPDSIRHWSNGSAALGQFLFWDTPEAMHDTLPALVCGGRAAMTAEARIDNRDELFDALSIAPAARRCLSDGELVRIAYEQWGPACARHLIGDWSFSSWHPEERRLVLARDHHGNTSIYYTRRGEVLAFASDRRALLALHGSGTHLNELYLAQLLVSWSAYQGSETIFQDIHRVPPAHMLVANPAVSTLSRYWRLEDTPEVHFPSADDYAEGLHAHLKAAVRARVRSHRPLAVMLSGGLDSGAVAILAARELGLTNRELLALTAVPLMGPATASTAGNEFRMAAATARSADNITHLAVASERISPLDGLEYLLAIHAEPGHAAANYYWLRAILEACPGHVLLTGQTGNSSLSWRGIPALSDVKAAIIDGDPARAIRAALRVAVATWPAPVARRLRTAWRHGWADQPWRRYSAIHPGLVERLQLKKLMAAAGHDPTFTRPPVSGRAAQLAELRPGRNIVGALWAELGASAGMVVRDPTHDVRLLTFVAGIPNEFWRGPMDRWLVRHAMKDVLPDEVRLARVRGRQAADLGARMQLESARTVELIQEIEDSPIARRYVDHEYLRTVAQSLKGAGWEESLGLGASVLLRGLCAGVFVARNENC